MQKSEEIMFYFYILFSSLIVSTFLGANEQMLHSSINKDRLVFIAQNEKSELKSLFEKLFKYHTFAYSLFGDKPLTFSDDILSDNFLFEDPQFENSLDTFCHAFFEIYCEPYSIFKKKWLVWKKYKDQFQLKDNFIFFEKKIKGYPRITIINKEAFYNVVNQNLKIFSLLDTDVSATKLLNAIVDSKSDLLDDLHNNEGLLGLLLGFGKHNSMLFKKREELENLSTKVLPPFITDPSLEKKIELLNHKLTCLHPHDPQIIASINRVCFLADIENEETQKIKLKFDNMTKKINEIYSSDNWFEQTLGMLLSP